MLHANDLDSREAEDMAVVIGQPDKWGHYTFQNKLQAWTPINYHVLSSVPTKPIFFGESAIC